MEYHYARPASSKVAETRSILNEQVRNIIAHLKRLQVVETRSVLNEQVRNIITHRLRVQKWQKRGQY